MEKLWAEATIIYIANPIGWSLALGALAAATIVVLDKNKETIWGWRNIIPNSWRGMMAKKARREQVKAQAAYDFVSAVMERVSEGIYSSDEAVELYRDLKKCFPIPECYASPELLKEAIEKRLASGMHAPVELEPLTKPRHAFDKMVKA